MNKDFNTLERIAINMADEVFGPCHIEIKTPKLIEEFEELIEVLSVPGIQKVISNNRVINLRKAEYLNEEQIELDKAKDELGDVLFVLLHISNKLGFTASDLIHHATLKMFNRIADPNYKKMS